LRTPWPIHFTFHRVIGIDGLTVCILYGEISNFHSRVMGLCSSNCRRFFVCRAVNSEPLNQFTSNFAQLMELIVLQSVYFLVKFRFFIQELWERKSLQILYECWRRAYHALLAQLFILIYQGPSWSWLYGSRIYNYLCNQFPSSLKLWVRTTFMARCTRHNIMWYSLPVTCDRSAVFSGYSCFLHQ
jgi:hypothetical protein